METAVFTEIVKMEIFQNACALLNEILKQVLYILQSSPITKVIFTKYTLESEV